MLTDDQLQKKSLSLQDITQYLDAIAQYYDKQSKNKNTLLKLEPVKTFAKALIALSFLSLVFQTALLTIFQYFSEENNSTRFNSTDLISISEGSAQAAVKFGLYFFFIPFVLGFIGSVILGAFKIAQTNYANHLDDNKHIIDFLVHLDLDITIPEEIKKASKDSIDLSSEQRAKLKKLIMGVIEINKSLSV